MKIFTGLVAFFAVFAACQNATKEEKLARALQLVQQMPECARNCLVQAVTEAGIPSTGIDISSGCNNKTSTGKIEACAIATCTIREQLSAKNITEVICERQPHVGPTISIAAIVGGGLSAVAYLMRMMSKVYFPCERGVRIDADLWWDDLAITLGFLLIIPISVLSNVLTSLGMGSDVWVIPPDNITKALKFFFYDEILYLLALPIIKIAICCTYLRIFPNEQFRKLTWIAIGLNVAFAITFFCTTIFQCSPINMAWLRWDGETPGHCNDINAQGWAAAAINIILDLIVIALPMPMLWGMNLNPRKKILVMLMFSVGFFVTFVSVLRLHQLVKFGDSKNVTYDYKQVGQWTVIEIDVALICACMPGIRNLIRRFFPRLMGQTMGGSSVGPTNGLSGRTAVGSGLDKTGTEVYVRPRHSDDGHFIPLENVSCQNLTAAEKDDASSTDDNQRNFSHPVANGTRPHQPLSPV